MLARLRENFSGKILLRIVYIAISLAGIIYELTKVEAVRWPLLAGYGFVIVAIIFVLRQNREGGERI